jgi:hypothetical protein
MRNLSGNKSHSPITQLLCGLAFFIMSVTVAAAAELPKDAAVLLRASACASLQPEFARITGLHSDIPAVREAIAYLNAMDQAANIIIHDLRVHRSKVSKVATVHQSAKEPTAELMGAAAIITKYQPGFTLPSLSNGLDEKEAQIVRTYLQTARQALIEQIQKYGQVCTTTIGADVPEIMSLCFVLPVLTSPTDLPITAERPAIPAWMKTMAGMKTLEVLSWRAGRFRLAYLLASPAESTTRPADAAIGYAGYVKRSANALFLMKDDANGIGILRDGIVVTTAEKQSDECIELVFELAENLTRTGDPKNAADEMQRLLQQSLSTDAYGKAAMLHIKYLYENRQWKQAVAQATEFRKDERVKSYLPQIFYVAWVSSRQDGNVKEADTWQTDFLTQFPNHSLAADIYFAKAMEMLALGKYDEAEQLLEFIEHRFPNSALLERTREIRNRLSQVVQ